MTNQPQWHKPITVRQAQNLASSLGHLNKGIESLVDLYAAAPELLEVLRELTKASFAIEPQIIRGGEREEIDFKVAREEAKQAIAKAEGRG